MSKLLVIFGMIGMVLACGNHTASVNRTLYKNGAVAGFDSAGWPKRFVFGHPATAATIDSIDTDIRPDGKGLPDGSGNAIAGSLQYTAKCAACHGAADKPVAGKLQGPPLFANPDSPQIKTIGNYWPYATTIFDYVRRSMPLNAPGSLTNNEVYALTAYLLHANKLLDTVTSLDARSLPKILMPAQKRFVTDDRRGGPEVK